jgi:iron complex transport system substrate-binding protein
MQRFGPTRIVSLQPSATVTLDLLGELDRVVACTKWCRDVCPALDPQLAIVADSWSAEAEQIIAAKPDLVIASVPYRMESLAEILKAGVSLLALSPRSLGDIYKDIALIAGIVGVADRGEALISAMQSEIEAVRRRTQSAPRPRVFCEEWGKPIIQSQLWVKELVEAAGGEFMGTPGEKRSGPGVSDGDAPEVFIAAWCGAGDRVPLERIIQQRHWEEMPAAVQGRIYCVLDELLNTPAPTLLKGLHALAWAIHPELFPQADGVRRISETRGVAREHLQRR